MYLRVVQDRVSTIPLPFTDYIVTYWVSLVVLRIRGNNANVAATINSASCYSSIVTRQ
jgi:hypothetical protein